MSDKTIYFPNATVQGVSPVPVLAHDNGDGTYSMGTTATVANPVINLGPVTMKDGVAATLASVKAASAIVSGDNAIAVHDPLASPVMSSSLVTNTVDFTASQTAQTIWTPGVGKSFVITDIIISASAAGAITIFDNTDDAAHRICKLNLGVNANLSVNYTKPRRSVAVNNVLKYTTGAGCVGSVTVTGYEV